MNSISIECENRLPGYLIPSELIALDNYPVRVFTNSDGKVESVIDRKALEEEALALLATKVVTPRSLIESEIEEIWRTQLSGKDSSQLNIKENFFNLGGDSLKAGQVVNAMRKKFKVSTLS